MDALEDELRAVAPEALEPGSEAALTQAFLLEVLAGERGHRAVRPELWRVSGTFNAWPSELATLAQLQPVATPRDREAALARFAEVPGFIERERRNLEEGLAGGWTAVRANVLAALRQLDALLSAPPEASPFVRMGEGGDEAFRTRLLRLEEGELRPAIARFRSWLAERYLPSAPDEGGMAALPGGEGAYRAAIRKWATVERAPEEVHALGLERMERIRGEMAELSARSFGGRPPEELLEALRTEPEFLLGGRDELLRIARDAVDRAERALPLWFGRVPLAPVEVRPVPDFAEASAPAAYYTAPEEGSGRPGIYHLNLRDAERQPLAGVESTAFHEAHPGHHTQLSLARETPGIHPVRQLLFLSGFGEGWALYSERLSDEMGLFTSDIDRMGLLSNEALRATRLIVDTGLHALGWTRAEAIACMRANTTEDPASIEAEVNRYLAVPGQAVSYMLGCVEVEALRARAEAALGEAFDLPAFHDALLGEGALPLGVLRERMEAWAG